MRRQGNWLAGPIAATRRQLRTKRTRALFNLTKSKTDIDRIVQELMEGDLTKAQRIKRLRDLAKSGDDVPEQLMDEALRKLMERITE